MRFSSSRRLFLALLLGPFTLPAGAPALAQSRLRNLSHETVAGRALTLADGSAEFHKSGQYRWLSRSGKSETGRWQLLSDVGPHPQVILVEFANGKQTHFRIRDDGGVLYLMRSNGRRFRILSTTPL